MVAKELDEGDFITSLERGLIVLRCFDRERPEMTLSEIATVTGLNAAVVRRCLNTLIKMNYVGRYGRKFLLRPEVTEFAATYAQASSLDAVVYGPLGDLRDTTGDSCAFGVLTELHIVTLMLIPTSQLVPVALGKMQKFPAHMMAMGRILLAHRSDENLEEYFDQVEMTKGTEHTLTTVTDVRAMLQKAKVDGYAVSHDELEYGFFSMAVPVFAPDGKAIAAINCSRSMHQSDPGEVIANRLPSLKLAAAQVERGLRIFPTLTHSLAQTLAPELT